MSQNRSDLFDYDVIVVDNEEIHDPPEEIRMMSRVCLLHQPLPGSYAARNLGAESATGEILAFTDADCLPDSDWLAEAAILFESGGIDAVGGEIELFREDGGDKNIYLYESRTAFPQKRHVPSGKCVTANFFVRRSIFERLGGFNQKMKSGGDWDFSLRVKRSGAHIVYSEKVMVQHPARKTLRDLMKKQKRLTAGGYRNVREKYGHSGLRIIGSTFRTLPSSMIKTVKNGKTSGEKVILMGISSLLWISRLITLFMILMRVTDPGGVRE